jgi:hypothetical protein
LRAALNLILNFTRGYDSLKKQRGGPALSLDRPIVFIDVSLCGALRQKLTRKKSCYPPRCLSFFLFKIPSLEDARALFGLNHHFFYFPQKQKKKRRVVVE